MTSHQITARVKRLKPEFVRKHHLGPISAAKAKARIELEAKLMNAVSNAIGQGRGQ